jgi:hypothetical protein
MLDRLVVSAGDEVGGAEAFMHVCVGVVQQACLLEKLERLRRFPFPERSPSEFAESR